MAYIDDHIGVDRPETAAVVHDSYNQTTDELGVVKQLPKCHPPLPETEYLGLDYDTNAMTVALPQDKLDRVVRMLEDWLHKERCHKVDLQRLVGTLNHCSYVVHPGRPFTARLLDALRAGEFPVSLSSEFHQDIKAWLEFLSSHFSGRSILKNVECMPVDHSVTIAVDGLTFACQVHSDVRFYYMDNDIDAKCESVALCAAIYQVCEEFQDELIGLPHLVSVPTKVAEVIVNRARVEHPLARALLRRAWITQARNDCVIRARAVHSVNRQNLLSRLKCCDHKYKFKMF